MSWYKVVGEDRRQRSRGHIERTAILYSWDGVAEILDLYRNSRLFSEQSYPKLIIRTDRRRKQFRKLPETPIGFNCYLPEKDSFVSV